MSMTQKEKAEAIKKQLVVINELLKKPENKFCADCKKTSPTWASVNLGVFVCINCSGCHREIGVHITKIRSVNLDVWPKDVLNNFKIINNKIANKYWECKLKKFDFKKIQNDNYRLVEFIRDKYEHKKWVDPKKKVDPMTLIIKGKIKKYKKLFCEGEDSEEEEEEEKEEKKKGKKKKKVEDDEEEEDEDNSEENKKKKKKKKRENNESKEEDEEEEEEEKGDKEYKDNKNEEEDDDDFEEIKESNINEKKKINQLKNKNITIFVFNMKPFSKVQELSNIICPKCKNLSLVNINNIDYKISINNCKNNHQSKNLTLNNYSNSQYIDESKIKCELCKNSKYLYEEEFYKCSCGLYICGLCFCHHNLSNHALVKLKYFFYNCLNDNQEVTYYCHNCHINLCDECNTKHRKLKHKLSEIKKLKPKDNKKEEIGKYLKENLKNLIKYKEEINVLNKFFNSYIENLNQNIDKVMHLHNKIYDSLNISKNYEEIMNAKDFKYEKFNKDLNEILSRNIKERFKYLIDVSNLNNQVKIKYSVTSEGKIKLFGRQFVENNKDNCFLFINNKLLELSEYYQVDESDFIYELSVILIEVKTITNISYMFSECNLLTYLDFSKWNNENVTDMSYMFSNCNSLSTLPEKGSINSANFLTFLTPVSFDFSNFNTSNVINMSYLFSNCVNLMKIPDISKWKTNKVTNMRGLFYNCSSLVSLPNINLWNVEKVTDMSYMFYGCIKLTTLPNISEWKPNCVTNLSNMFNNCININSIPDISEWNTNNVVDMNNLFNNCSKIFSLPDISKWNVHNVTDLSYMFNNCSMLSKIPDISKWNTSKVITMKSMFNNCSSLLSLPELSGWDTQNVKDMSFLFKDCTSLYYGPKISNWKTDNLQDMSYLLYNIKLDLMPELFTWNLNNVKNMEKIFDSNNLNINSNNIKYQCKLIKVNGLLKSKSINSLNSILQCFCSIEKFINYFKYIYSRNNSNNLCSSFKIILDKLWPNNNEVETRRGKKLYNGDVVIA